MKPKTAFAIVLIMVITGEAIADYFARNISTFIGLAILIFSALFIRAVSRSQKQ